MFYELREIFYDLSEQFTKINTIIIFIVSVTLLGLSIFADKDNIITNLNIQSAIKGIQISGEQAIIEQDQQGIINGSRKGIFISGIFAQPLMPEITGLEKGLAISGNIALQIEAPEEEMFQNLLLLERISNLIEINIQNEILDEPDRGLALQNHVNTLENLLENAISSLQGVVADKISSEAVYDNAVENSEEIEDLFFNRFDNYEAAQAEDLYVSFLEQEQIETQKQAQLGVLISLEERFEFFIPLLTDRINTIEENRVEILLGCEIPSP